MSNSLNFVLEIWRQKERNINGEFKIYNVSNVSPDMSFLEMIDLLNEQLASTGEEPVSFESDCREGICGACSLVINGVPHGSDAGTTTCQIHMRNFSSGDKIIIEPFRAKAFPIIKDLVSDRSSFDRVMQSGGYVSVNTGTAQDGNSISVNKKKADAAFDAAACIGCGACVAACKNASASLFVGAKIFHLSNLPQGHPEKKERVVLMVNQAEKEGFGHCTNTLECEAVCPKEINAYTISRLNKEYIRSFF